MKPKTEKNKRFWSLSPIILLLTLALAAAVMVSFFYNRILFYVELVLFAAVLIVIGWRLRRMKKDIGRYLRRIAGSLNQSEQDALSAFPLPVMVSAVNGEIIWYNDLFRHQVLDGNELFGIIKLIDTDIIRGSKTASWLLDQVLFDISSMKTLSNRDEPMSPYPDGDTSIIACPCCGSGEFLHNEDGNEMNFCGQCGQRIDWEQREDD